MGHKPSDKEPHKIWERRHRHGIGEVVKTETEIGVMQP